jgi:hypothetical protein
MRRPSRRCAECWAVIPAARLALLPDTQVCVKCSKEDKQPVEADDLVDADDMRDVADGNGNI